MNKNCFAREGGGCGVLKYSKCPDRPCKFHKTKTQLKSERQKSYDRIIDIGRLDLFDKYVVPKE
jgi:hypothetical protein